MSPIRDLTPIYNRRDRRPEQDGVLGRWLLGLSIAAILVGLVMLYFTLLATAVIEDLPPEPWMWTTALTGFGAAFVAAGLAFGCMHHGRRAVGPGIGLGVFGAAFVTWIWVSGPYLT